MKKIISIALCMCIFFSCASAFGADVSSFSDINPNDWYYSDVKYVVSHNLFNGISETKFGAGSSMTRGMFVTVLGRYAGEKGTVPSPPTGSNPDNGQRFGKITASDVRMRSAPTTNGSTTLLYLNKNTQVQILDYVNSSDGTSYKWYKILYSGKEGYVREDLMTPVSGSTSGDVLSDVPSDLYYAPYVYWALDKGIAGKTGSNSFSPESPITREDICSMLYNYAKVKHYQLAATVGEVTFTDASSISASCKEAVTALQRCGMIEGYPDGKFLPKNGASRAEVSAFIVRFINCISYKPDNSPSLDANGNYIWGRPMPEGISMNSSYLNDACFIGHSIVVGMETYFGLDQTDFYAVNSATTKNIVTHDKFKYPVPFVDENGVRHETGKLEDVLASKSYGKVYIMLGINEVGTTAYNRTVFYNNMSSIIDMVRKLQPTAKLYLFSSTPVSKSCSESREDLSRDNIIELNKTIQKLCASKYCYYLNVFDLLANSDGFLPDGSGMNDGIHILSPEHAKIKSYVLNHAA